MCIRHFPIHLLHMLINTRKKNRQHFRTKCSFNHINLPSIARISDTGRIKRLWPEVETAQQHWKPVTFSDLHNNQGREPHPWPNRISWEGGRKYYAHRSHSQDPDSGPRCQEQGPSGALGPRKPPIHSAPGWQPEPVHTIPQVSPSALYSSPSPSLKSF